jgi:Fe-S-cluster containining protein
VNSLAPEGTDKATPSFILRSLRYPLFMHHPALPAGDRQLVQIVDAALADATRRSGAWLVCRPGCTQCCFGVFSISQLDALRLQHGLNELGATDPERAARVRSRAKESVERLAPDYPGNPKTGILDPELEDRFIDFANNEPCPALDPTTGMCDLYSSRPITCRAFGPPVRSEEGLGVCELCFQGATEQEIAACEMEVDPDDLESKILREIKQPGEREGETIVAFALTCTT